MTTSKPQILSLATALAAALLAAPFPAAAQRSITVLDGARKTPVLCEAAMTHTSRSATPVTCKRLDVLMTAPNAVIGAVPAGFSLALTDLRAYCENCQGREFNFALYGFDGQAIVAQPFDLWGAAPIADWHGAGPFLVLPAGSQLRVSGVIPADRGDEVIRAVATGYLTRADQLGQ